MRGVGLASLLLITPIGTSAFAHSGAPAVAWIQNPTGTIEIADQSYTVRWVDSDRPTPTGSATISIYYTEAKPPTYVFGRMPLALTGTVVAEGILEDDTTNQVVWDLSSVPSGTYWVWSRVDEPPEFGSIQIIAFSPGVLTVAHPGDPIGPAVVITVPDTPYRFSDKHYVIHYSAFDPDRSARVRLEATQSSDGSNLITIADDLPAIFEGSFDWDTSQLPEGDWTLRATITDDRGMTFSAYSHYFLLIRRFEVDGGRPVDAAVVEADAGALSDGSSSGGDDGGGDSCGCHTTSGGATSLSLGCFLVLLALRKHVER